MAKPRLAATLLSIVLLTVVLGVWGTSTPPPPIRQRSANTRS